MPVRPGVAWIGWVFAVVLGEVCYGEVALAPVLKNMPTNSKKRCVGISAMTEALLEGEQTTTTDQPSMNSCARQIYRRILTGEQVRFPAHFTIDGEKLAISDRRALDKLSTQVTELYVQDHLRVTKTSTGANKLAGAERKALRSLKELDRILDAEPDHLEFFCCIGSRRFPDETYKTTYHAALIHKLPSGTKVVYDSNDPGKPHDCKFYEEPFGLTVEWTCQYRDTGLVTTQRYELIEKEKYFRVIHDAAQK